MPRLATALALLGILAFAVFGCGGGSDTTSSSTDGGSGSTTTTTGQGSSTDTADKEGGSESKGSKEDTNGKGGSGSQEGSGSAGGPTGPGLAEKAKPDTKGFKAPPGGDNSIQTFGGEAESSEEKEITTAMASFLRAMAARDYNAICEGLSEANIGQLEQLMKLKKEAGTDCPSVLKSLLVGPTDEAQKAAEGTVYQVRVEGENAFVMFTPVGGTASYFVMKHDPDGWKSTSLSSGTPFNPGAAE